MVVLDAELVKELGKASVLSAQKLHEKGLLRYVFWLFGCVLVLSKSRVGRQRVSSSRVCVNGLNFGVFLSFCLVALWRFKVG